jgi:hypothetical protein
MLGSTTSAVLFTSKLIVFAQKSGNIALQTGYQPSIDHLANLIHNKTGIDEVSVKPILEQMALQPTHDTLDMRSSTALFL